MSVKFSKPMQGQWIVKLEKLKECKDCHEFFTDFLSFKKHIKVHKDESRTKTEYQEGKLYLENSKLIIVDRFHYRSFLYFMSWMAIHY